MQNNMKTTTTERSRNRKYLWLLLIVTLLLAVAAVLFLPPTNRTETKQTSSTTASRQIDTLATVMLSNQSVVRAGVGVVRVESRDFESAITAVGIITIPEPNQRIVAARARGRIERMFVSASGQYVKEGEPLYEFYSPDILNAEREYQIAYTQWSNTQNIHASMPAHDHSLADLILAAEQRLYSFGLSAAQVKELRVKPIVPNTIVVVAPRSGLVLQRLAQEGAYVDEGSSILQLADLSTVWAEINVPEAAIRYLRVGQRVGVQSAAYPGESFSARVIFISPVEDQTSRTIRVRAELANPGYRVRPQMTFTANIPIGASNALAVPASAVIRTGKGDFVWMHTGANSFTSRSVTLGALSSDNLYQVLSGLNAGDEVAAQGAFLIDAEYQFSKTNPMAGMNMGQSGNKTSGEGHGTVRAIDVEHQMITLDHGNIPGVMPAMTMQFKVSDPTLLQAAQVNDAVRFTLTRQESGSYVVTSIVKERP